MDEVPNRFEIGACVDEKLNPEDLKLAINLCVAKLQSFVATKQVKTNENPVEPISSEKNDENTCLIIQQEELFSAELYAIALTKLFRNNDPEYENYKKLFRFLLSQLKKNNNEMEHLLKELDNLTPQVIETKLTLKQEQTKLDTKSKIKSSNKDRSMKEYMKKIKNVNNFHILIREMIMFGEMQTDREMYELLKKYRKPYKPEF